MVEMQRCFIVCFVCAFGFVLVLLHVDNVLVQIFFG